MSAPSPGRMPALFLGHGAPPLVDDATWTGQLRAWAADLPRPRAVLVISAHWESAPLTIGATTTVPLVHDFYGFPRRYYTAVYPAPGAGDLADRVAALLPAGEPVAREEARGLDHGAYVPLMVMYPQADIPVLQVSLPTLAPVPLLRLGRRLAPLREEGVLIVGSGFLTHGLPYLRSFAATQPPPAWSREFDAWAGEALDRGDLEELLAVHERAPALRYAHPRLEHLAPLYLILGAATDPQQPVRTRIDGFWTGLAKRSFEVA